MASLFLAPSAVAATAAVPICHTSAISVGQVKSNGADETQQVIWGFKNHGHSCSMIGYPGVSFVNKSNHAVNPPAHRARHTAAKKIVLKPGQTALFTTFGYYNTRGCVTSKAGVKMRFFIPNGGVPLYAYGSAFYTCGMTVGPVRYVGST